MATIISHNIISPLGFTSEENLEAIVGRRSSIGRYSIVAGGERPYSASLFPEQMKDALKMEGYTRYESLVIQSIERALQNADVKTDSQEVCLILSTTKGSVEDLTVDSDAAITPAFSAQRIADYFNMPVMPVTVCNACISGVSAMLLGQRLIDSGVYKYAIVSGCDTQCKFIISGFQSLNAVSPDPCLPFDIERTGLSVGEAATTVVLGADDSAGAWHIKKGCVRNDAYHNTTPSPKGEGSSLTLLNVTAGENIEEIGFINAHGTATMYNDQMESKAIERAGLQSLPVNALKGYFGHTMGAAGIMETIISMLAADRGIILPTNGFSLLGVSGKINVVNKQAATSKQSFIKMISGFGGSNGSLLVTKKEGVAKESVAGVEYDTLHKVVITNEGVEVDGVSLSTVGSGKALLKELYSNEIGNYPKYHKMDLLSQLGFVAMELLLKAGNDIEIESEEQRAIVLFNRSSSIITDKEYLKTISDDENYFPSPALFVYTLPNIVMSEVSIKNGIKGETSLYLIPRKDEKIMDEVKRATFCDTATRELITGWIDCADESHFVAELTLLQRKK